MTRLLKEGDKVVYINKGCDADTTPRWGGKYGYIVGKVYDVRPGNDYPVKVKWGNGRTNCYSTDVCHRMELYTWKHRLQRWRKCDLKALDQSKVRTYIVLLALAIVLDQFLLKGRLTNKFREMVEKFINATVSSVNKAVDKITGSE